MPSDTKRSLERWGIVERNVKSKRNSNKPKLRKNNFSFTKQTIALDRGIKSIFHFHLDNQIIRQGCTYQYLILTETGTSSLNLFLVLTFKEPHFGKTHFLCEEKKSIYLKVYSHKLSSLTPICSFRHLGLHRGQQYWWCEPCVYKDSEINGSRSRYYICIPACYMLALSVAKIMHINDTNIKYSEKIQLQKRSRKKQHGMKKKMKKWKIFIEASDVHKPTKAHKLTVK